MVSSPFKNCGNFFRTRPPFVIFFICLASLAVATFSFAFYIQQTEKLVNTDAKQDWYNLAELLTKTDLCHSNEVETSLIETTTFSTLITFNATSLGNYSKIEANYDLTDWHPNCPVDYATVSELKVEFSVPRGVETKVCARIRGSKSYLPRYLRPGCEFNDTSSGATAKFWSKNGVRGNDLCRKGIVTRLKFDGGSNEGNFAIFLSQDDRNVIYVHLMWCSSILSVFVVIMLLYAMFQNNHRELEDQWLQH